MPNVKDSRHLTLEEREELEEMLRESHGKTSLKEIAKTLNKDPRTISKEVKLRRVKYPSKKKDDPRYAEWDKSPCKWLSRWPFVCNGCPMAGKCARDRCFYRAKPAHESYRQTLVDSRSGVDLSKEELEKIDRVVSKGVRNKQSLYAIAKNHPDEIDRTSRTVYNYVHKGILSVGPIDLHNAVKLKPRNRKYAYAKTREQCSQMAHRGFSDYQMYIGTNDVRNIVQMDTVEGTRERGKVLLTIHFPSQHFMIIRLLERKLAKNVTLEFDRLERILGLDEFSRLFGVVLTDRGAEFMDIEGLERSCTEPGMKRTRVFFCAAYESSQKGAIESNHRLIRYVIPKKASMDFLTPEMVQRLQDNISCYCRDSIAGWYPYEMFVRRFGEEDANKLGFKKIDPRTVNLSPALLLEK